MIRRALFFAFIVLNLSGGVIIYNQWVPVNLVLILLPVNMLIFFGVSLISKNQLKQLYILTGGKSTKIDFNTIQEKLTKNQNLLLHVNNAIKGLDESEKDKYLGAVQSVTNADLKESLLSASTKMDTLHKMEIHNNFVVKGIADLGQLQYAEISKEAYASQVLTMVVKYLNATQGAVFMKENSDSETYMVLAASYALGERKNKTDKIYAGQGTLGQVMVDKEMVCMTNVPTSYVKVSSGLGQALPVHVCIIPFVSDDGFYGALEIGSFETLQPYHIEYLQKVSKTVGYNLASQESVRKTAALLLESTKLTEEMKIQDEEIRQNLSAITDAKNEMQKKHIELTTVLTSLATVELNMSGEIREASSIFTSISGFKPEDIQGRLFKHLIPAGQNDQMQYDLMWSNLLEGKSFSGEFRLLNKDKKEVWIMGNFTPILDERGNPYKIMLISMFTTQDKEKLSELQESLNALKQCLPMVEVNKDLGFKTANELFLNSVGLKRIDLRKASLHSLFDNDSKQWIENHFQSDTQDHAELIVNIKTSEGKYKPCHVTLVKVLDGNAFKRGFIIIKEELAHFSQLTNSMSAQEVCHA